MFKKLGLLVLAFLLFAGATGCKKEKEDPLMAEVNLAISAFMENYLDKYVSTKDDVVLDYYVVAAVKALEDNGYKSKLNSIVDVNKVTTTYETYDYSSINNIFKALVVKKALGLNLDKEKNEMNKITEVDTWSYTSALMAANIAGVNDNLKQDLLTKVNVIKEEDFRDADYCGIALMATANENINKEPLYDLINSSLSSNGVVTWGGANSSSTASVVLGLVANGVNPTGDKYTTDEVNLIMALLKYHKNGAFANKIGEDVDLMFATPQVFSALVAYKIFTKTNKFILFS